MQIKQKQDDPANKNNQKTNKIKLTLRIEIRTLVAKVTELKTSTPSSSGGLERGLFFRVYRANDLRRAMADWESSSMT